MMVDVAGNLVAVRARIAAACAAAGRAADGVVLVVASKRQEEEKIAAALAAGQRVFGENRVQEAQQRWGARRAAGVVVELHLIGPLQTNKIKEAVALFDVIQSVDRAKLARGLAAEMARVGRRLRCFVQVNVGREPQKAGVMPEDVAAFVAFCREECGLDVGGLMCIPPAGEAAAPYFEMLAGMARELGLAELSMGMSDDYAAAIACGATYVRVGTAVFGARG